MRRYVLMFVCGALLAACEAEAPTAAPVAEEEKVNLVLAPASYDDLPGWEEDDISLIAPALDKSCARILKNAPDKKFGPLEQAGTYGLWQEKCKIWQSLAGKTTLTVRQFLLGHFIPHLVMDGDKAEGLFTGYYEAALKGSRIKTDQYKYPIYARPDDLVMVDLGEFREELKGQRIAGRVTAGNLKPYEDRGKIEAGDWPHGDKVLVWADNAVDVFFLHIQGSGRVDLDGGDFMRVGYAGQNGHPYFAIGKELIARGDLTKETVSMQTIREWLAAHPDQADAVMNKNASYVFFQELSKEDGPVGGEGVSLTPERSLAIDRALLPYGLPLWVDIAPPKEGEAPIRRLMMAQDTGGAIRGAVRGDVFWGYGLRAEDMAGVMKSKGRYWVLLPNAANTAPAP